MGSQYAQIDIGPTVVIAAGTSDDIYMPFMLPGRYLIEQIRFMPSDAVTANGTNFTAYTLTNVTASTTIATRSYAATNSVAGTVETVTLPTGLAAVVSAGDVLRLQIASSGTGVASQSRFHLRLLEAPLP